MIEQGFGGMLFFLLVGHYLADFPLQSEFVVAAKNRNTEIGRLYWPHALFGHSLIHGGFVAFITGHLLLGVLETCAHGLVDWLKCENKISFNQDQLIHLACKLVWCVLVLIWP